MSGFGEDGSMKKIAIVTGSSGGLGTQFVRLLIKEDVDEIWCVARNRNKLEALKSECGDRLIPLPLDLSDMGAIHHIRKRLEEQRAVVSFLINNAGVGEKLSSYREFSLEQISGLIAVNCTCVAALCTACIPNMAGGSRIVNMASQSAFQPVPHLNLYASSKAFVRSYTRALNAELAGTGITATAVCPGWVDTDMLPREINGKTVKYPGAACAGDVAHKALSDAKKGKDSSVYSLYVKYMHGMSKILPQKLAMKIWMMSVKKYLG